MKTTSKWIVSKAQKAKDESHSISDINLVNLKNAIENPIAVIENSERNAFVFVTNLKENGKYVIVGFEKSTLFDGDKVHKATSIHSRQNIDLYLKKINNSNIFVENENKLIEMFQGVQNDIERLKQNNKSIKIMTAPQLSVDTVKESASANIISNSSENVNKNSSNIQNMLVESSKSKDTEYLQPITDTESN